MQANYCHTVLYLVFFISMLLYLLTSILKRKVENVDGGERGALLYIIKRLDNFFLLLFSMIRANS